MGAESQLLAIVIHALERPRVPRVTTLGGRWRDRRIERIDVANATQLAIDRAAY